jgi:TRAP-type transport system periplasmic protein
MKNLRSTLALLALSALPAIGIAQEIPKTSLRLAHYIGQTAVQSQVDEWWGKELDRRSGGAIKVTFYWSESMGKATELLDLVGSGGVELASTSPAYYPARLPYSAVTHLPMLLKDNKQAQLVQTDLMALPPLVAENKRNKVVPLMWHSLPSYRLICTKPIRTMADFKGAKLRSFGEYLPVLWKSIGAVGVTVLPPEIYEGLQRGNIDCAYLSLDIAANLKLYEVAKYVIDLNFGAISAWPVYMNAEYWSKLPEGTRKLIAEVSQEAAARERDAVADAATAGLETMKKNGVQIVEFKESEAFHKAAPDMLEVWTANMTKKGDGENARLVAAYMRTKMQ